MDFSTLTRAAALAAALAAPGVAPGAAHAATYYVAQCGQDAWAGVQAACAPPWGPKRTIQAAIDAATSGDTILVGNGVYPETIDYDGKAIALIGVSGAAATIIDGQGQGPVVLCNSAEGAGTVLQGFTITGGRTDESGAGMLNVFSSPTIVACVFEGNDAEQTGGGIANIAAVATITDCQFVGNVAYEGGGVMNRGGTVALSGCRFATNVGVQGGGLSSIENAAVTVDDCVFEDNEAGPALPARGAGMLNRGATVDASGCTFTGNRSISAGGGFAGIAGSTTSFVGSTFTDNRNEIQGGAVEVQDSTLSLLACSFAMNSAGLQGGAVSVLFSVADVTWCSFDDNTCEEMRGGALVAEFSTLEVDGCTFDGNRALTDGGALAAIGGTTDLDACTFENNANQGDGDGGAVSVRQGDLVADACVFEQNACTDSGGGLAVEGPGVTAQVTRCTFVENSGFNGGGLRLYRGQFTVDDCTFTGNQAHNVGGGISCPGSTTVVRVTDSRFDGNVTAGIGGGMGASGRTTVVRTSFTGNAARAGGGVGALSGQSRPVIASCRFEGNQAEEGGAALMIGANGNATMVNCLVTGNTTVIAGGAVQESENGGTLVMVNTAIVDNIGGGVRIDDPDTDSVIANTILRDNPFGLELIGHAPAVRYCNVEGGAAGPGNMDVDPLFVNPAVGNYRLAAGSPCIDAGANWALPLDTPDLDTDGNTSELIPLDLAGAPRLADDIATRDGGCGGPVTVDLGPYEVAGVPVDDVTPGDVNGDGVVDVVDLLAVLAAWGPCVTECCPADFDLNGVIDVADLLVPLANWD